MPCTVTHTEIPDVLILEPKVFDDRLLESFNAQDFAQATGLNVQFVQDNHSPSAQGVPRGLHYQLQQPQGKLLRGVRGAVFDVAVDIRKYSPSFGQWVGCDLSENNHRQYWLPPVFAHRFVGLSETADFLYKTTDYSAPELEHCIVWNDPAIGIEWPIDGAPVLTAKDQQGKILAAAEHFA